MKVINLKTTTETKYTYIGRANSFYGLRGSALANPYRASKFGRAQAVEMYRRWLWEQIEVEEWRVIAALRELNEDSTLACWCKPQICHGDVVVAAWRWIRANRPSLLE